jgi:hypothetical protein
MNCTRIWSLSRRSKSSTLNSLGASLCDTRDTQPLLMFVCFEESPRSKYLKLDACILAGVLPIRIQWGSTFRLTIDAVLYAFLPKMKHSHSSFIVFLEHTIYLSSLIHNHEASHNRTMAGVGIDAAEMMGLDPEQVDRVRRNDLDMSLPSSLDHSLAEAGGRHHLMLVEGSHKLSLSAKSTHDCHFQSIRTMSLSRNQQEERGITARKALRRTKTYRNARPSPIQTRDNADLSLDLSVSSNDSVTYRHPEAPRHATRPVMHFFPSPRSVLDRRSSSESFF